MKKTEKISTFITLALAIAIGLSIASCICIENIILDIVFATYATIAIVAFVLNLLCMKN